MPAITHPLSCRTHPLPSNNSAIFAWPDALLEKEKLQAAFMTALRNDGEKA